MGGIKAMARDPKKKCRKGKIKDIEVQLWITNSRGGVDEFGCDFCSSLVRKSLRDKEWKNK